MLVQGGATSVAKTCLMGDNVLLDVPVIDVAPFRSGGAAVRQAVADEVGRAVNDIGFLVITGHGIDPDLVAEVQAVSNAFFDLPEDEKRKVLRPAPDVTRGYIPLEAESVGRSQGVDAPGDLNESLSTFRRTPITPRRKRAAISIRIYGRAGRKRCGPPMKPISARWAGWPKT